MNTCVAKKPRDLGHDYIHRMIIALLGFARVAKNKLDTEKY